MKNRFDVVQKQSKDAVQKSLELSYPYVVQRLVKIVGLIHEVVFENTATHKQVSIHPHNNEIHWRGRGDAWLVVPQMDDGTEYRDLTEHRIINFLQGEVARNGREMCLVTSETSCIYIHRDGRVERSETVPREGLLLLISSMVDD